MRIILHVDMDAFYASIEQRDNPRLRGEPVIVGGKGGRGVVSTCSYEARPFGVHSAQPMQEALKRCPEATVLSPRMSYYSDISACIMHQLEDFSPRVETLSLDEAFVDMTGAERLFGPPEQMARQIKERIYQETELTASVGIATNKFLAKLATELQKPDGIGRIPAGQEAESIASMGVDSLWGVGPKTKDRLHAIGLATIGDVASADRAWLCEELGALGSHIYELSHGRDDRPVVPDSKRKSIGSERTFSENITGRALLERALRQRCREVARELRKNDQKAAGVRLKVRYDDTFQIRTRQTSLRMPSDDSESLFMGASSRLETLDVQRPIRLVGAAAYDLVESGKAIQPDLFSRDYVDKTSRLEHTIDEINEKFGDKVKRADSMKS